MNTWPNRGASGGPRGGLADNEIKQSREVSPSRSDSSQQASSKPGAVQSAIGIRLDPPLPISPTQPSAGDSRGSEPVVVASSSSSHRCEASESITACCAAVGSRSA